MCALVLNIITRFVFTYINFRANHGYLSFTHLIDGDGYHTWRRVCLLYHHLPFGYFTSVHLIIFIIYTYVYVYVCVMSTLPILSHNLAIQGNTAISSDQLERKSASRNQIVHAEYSKLDRQTRNSKVKP